MTDRNFDNIQHEKLRRNIDNWFNLAHDKLGARYYVDKTITKDVFDKQHALLWHIYDFVFHKENLKQAAEDIISEEKYNEIRDRDNNVVTTKSEQAIELIKAHKLVDVRAIATRLKAEGLDLTDIKTRLQAEGITLGV